ncbi:DegT/DnrJ/EryC1/StrS family aminotransferase [Cytophagaceae bacterium ABcell3]|nr:DegT/DnrJ/EryC1/StrS family aminotransferase [Cytophagaceae bacterium ABcell3]
MPEIKFSDLKRILAPQMPDIKGAMEEVVDSGWYILGNKVKEFERVFASFVGTSFCVGTGSGLGALTLSLEALCLPAGSEVLLPANTSIATALAVSRSNLVPVFVDVDPATFNIDVADAQRKVKKHTRAVIAVHLFGRCCDMDALLTMCQTHGLFLIEDVAQANGATYKGEMAGSFGHISAFSFYPTKNLGALGDGGAVLTNDEGLYDKVLKLRNYGALSKDEHELKGANCRLDEIQAAVLLVRMKFFEQQQQERLAIARFYCENITNPYIIVPENVHNGKHAWHLFVVRCKHRAELVHFLKPKGIDTLIHYPKAIHQQKAYKEFHQLTLPVVEQLQEEILSIPLYPGLRWDEVEYIVKVLNDFAPTNN